MIKKIRLGRLKPAAARRPADDEVVFTDGVGAGRSSIKSCRDGVQWIKVGDRVYWPLSDSDAKRLQSACCGNGSFDGPTTPEQAVEIEALRAESLRKLEEREQRDEALLRQTLEALEFVRSIESLGMVTDGTAKKAIAALRERLGEKA